MRYLAYPWSYPVISPVILWKLHTWQQLLPIFSRMQITWDRPQLSHIKKIWLNLSMFFSLGFYKALLYPLYPGPFPIVFRHDRICRWKKCSCRHCKSWKVENGISLFGVWDYRFLHKIIHFCTRCAHVTWRLPEHIIGLWPITQQHHPLSFCSQHKHTLVWCSGRKAIIGFFYGLNVSDVLIL